jgi:tRNA threonylcarbamoyladenosine biosynthesis protein TsaB
MRMIAIETSGRHGSLAALRASVDEVEVLRQVDLVGEPRTAQSLAPQLRQMLAASGWQPQTIDVVAVTNGPGSFTGLRLGVTTAKVFAYAVNAEIIAVNTLAVIASQVPQSPVAVWAILDAQRQELFAAKFTITDDGRLHDEVQTRIVSQETWLAELRSGDQVTGPALKRLAGRLPSNVVTAEEALWPPTAAAVGQLAWQAYRNGRRDDVWKLSPAYYRPSAAEEKKDSLSRSR